SSSLPSQAHPRARHVALSRPRPDVEHVVGRHRARSDPRSHACRRRSPRGALPRAEVRRAVSAILLQGSTVSVTGAFHRCALGMLVLVALAGCASARTEPPPVSGAAWGYVAEPRSGVGARRVFYTPDRYTC